MTKPTKWQFSRKRDGQPIEKLSIEFPERWGEPKPSEVLDLFQAEVERLGLDEE
jgi:hypothetical protein